MDIPINLTCTVVFGVPGSGKSTLATKLARQEIDKYDVGKDHFKVFSNFFIEGAIELDPLSDIGVYDIRNAIIIIDEAGIDFNNRKYKTFPDRILKWAKLHRHYKCSVFVFSQAFDDMDITFRRIAQSYWVCRKLPFKVLLVRPIRRVIGIDEQTHQIVDWYFWDNWHIKLVLMKKYWKFFDSYDAPLLEPKKWTRYKKKKEPPTPL